MVADRPVAAAGIVFTAMFLLSFFDNLVSQVAPEIGLWQFHLVRSLIAVGVLTVIATIMRARLKPINHRAVLARSGFAAIAMLIYFGCLGFLPVGQVAAGLFTSPIWVMLISAVFFNKPIALSRMTAALIGFVGVVIVLDPFSGEIQLAALAPVVAGMFYALGSLATRQWCEGESALSMVLYFFLSLVLAGLIGASVLSLLPIDVPPGADGFILRGFVWTSGWVWFLIAVQAVGALVSMALLFRGYQLGETGQVAIFEYSFLGFAAGWSFLLYGEELGLQAGVGMALIVISGIIISLRSRER